MTIIARAIPNSLARALRSPRESGVVLASHGRRLAERLVGWPAAVFLVTTGPLRAGVVQQTKPNVLPKSALAVEPDGVDLLDLNRSAAAPTAHPQKVSGNVG